MPPLYVEFMPDTIDGEAAQKLVDVLRPDTAERFGVPGRPLTEDDMTVIFVELHKWSEPTHDIVVRMQLHNDQQRLDKADHDAAEMAHLIADTLRELRIEEELTVGVALGYFPIAWGTASVPRNSFDDSDR